MPVVNIFMRSDHSSMSDPLNPIYIAGFCVAGVVVLGLTVWLLAHFIRKRSATKREESRGAAFLSVRGIVSEQGEKDHYRSTPAGFSRNQINSSVVLPDKVLARPPRTREEVMDFHRQSGTFPQPFSAKPFSFALSAASPSPSSPTQGSFLSFGSSSAPGSRLSVYSVMSAYSTVDTTGSTRKVRQIFDPVLPDELLLSGVGEELTLVQSFDDGWCLVGREHSTFAAPAKSLFKKGDVNNDVELGVVPAWCFIKPVQGLKTERPVRSSSLGITVQMTGPAFSSRDAVLSWSNF